MGEIVTTGWGLQKDSDSLEPVAVDLLGQRKHAKARKAGKGLD